MIYFWFSSQDLWLLWMPKRKSWSGEEKLQTEVERSEKQPWVETWSLLYRKNKFCEFGGKSDRTTAPEWITISVRGFESSLSQQQPNVTLLSAIKSPEKGRHRQSSIAVIQGRFTVCHTSRMTVDITSTPHTGVKVLDEALNLICALRTTGCFISRNVHFSFAGAV